MWHEGISERELRDMCCHAGAKCQDGMSRGDLVKTCVAVAHTAQIDKDDLKRLCETTSDGRAATRAAITQCVFKRMVKSIEAGDGKGNPPTCLHGSNGKCPLGYEDGPNSCCQPSQAPDGATLATADLAKSSLGMMDSEHVKQLLEEGGAQPKDVKKAVAAYRKEEETMELMLDDNLGKDEDTGRKFMAFLATSTKAAAKKYAEVQAQATRYFAQPVDETGTPKEEGWLMWGIKRAGGALFSGLSTALKYVGKGLKTMWGFVSPWVTFTIQNPTAMKLITLILLEFRGILCKKLSSAMGYDCKLPPKSLMESMSAYLPSANAMGSMALHGMQKALDGGAVNTMLAGASDFVLGNAADIASSVPFVGGLLKAGINAGTKMAAAAAEEALRMAAYRAAITGVFNDVLNLFVAPCLQPVHVDLTGAELKAYREGVESGRIKLGDCAK